MSNAQYYLEKVDKLLLLKRKQWHLSRIASKKTISKVECIFIAGMQRSGTNLVMDILERSLDTDIYHERDQRAFDNYEMRDRAVIHDLVDFSKADYFVIKALCESQYLRSLLDEFEPAKALWVVRNFEDAVNSMVISFSGFTKRIKMIAEDRNSCGWRGKGMSDETHAIVRKHCKPDINEVTAAALKWYYRNILFFEQNLDKDNRVKLIAYEQLVTQPIEEAQRIFQFLGPAFHPRVVRWVSPRSIRRRPPPDIDKAVWTLCDNLMQRFQHVLEQN
jgi:hypothetical protein